jgi:CxxC-x17-CxxC domain-containing protein
MNNFNRNGGGSRGGFGDRKPSGGGFGRREGGDRGGFGRRDSGDRSFGRPEMHKAVCAECGNDCEVPFKPSGERPVLCSVCFGSKDAGAPRQSFSRDRDSSRDFPKPSFHAERHPEGRPDHSKEQFEALNAKLDKVINALERLSASKTASVKEVSPIKEITKIEVAKKVEKVEPKKVAEKPAKKAAAPKKKTSKK